MCSSLFWEGAAIKTTRLKKIFSQSRRFLRRSKRSVLFASLAVAGLAILSWYQANRTPLPGSPASYPEVAQLSAANKTFADLAIYFSGLAKEKGAEYAYQVLKVAALPSGTDLHLLGHTVGDILYKQRGADGIKICTPDFRNACSHSIAVGLFTDHGIAALPQIAQACRQAPGGSGAYTMCFHGLGHGILAYYGYDMAKAADACQKTSTQAYNYREGLECVGGMVMEIISGGGHDHDLWVAANARYLHADAPLSLCQQSFIPKEAKPMCYVYLTPYLFIAAGGSLDNPGTDFSKAFSYCNSLTADDKENRDSCFGGFGKEFIVLAQNRDIRRIDQLTETQLRQVQNWCAQAGERNGIAACIINAVNSMYWGGENDYRAAVKFCQVSPDEYQKNSCFVNLIGAVFYYRSDRSYRQDFCSALPNPYQNDCTGRLNGGKG